MITVVEQKILQAYRDKSANVIGAADLVKMVGSNAGAVTGLIEKGYVQRQVVNSRTYYVLLREPDSNAAPRKLIWQPVPRGGNAIDRHLKLWGTCTIEADCKNWEFGAQPIYQQLEGKSRC